MVKKWFIHLFILLIFSAHAAFSQDLTAKLNQKISPNFSGTSLDNALRLFAQQYSLNLIMSSDVQGRVNVQLYNVSLSDALNAILKVNGYHYIVENDVILVKPFDTNINGELETHVFKLLYLDGFKLKTTLEPLLSPKGKIEARLEFLARMYETNKAKQDEEKVAGGDSPAGEE